MYTSVVETERLILREFTTDDETALRLVFADPYARQFYASMSEQGAVRRWIEKNVGRYRQDGYGLWAACLRDTGELVGDCGLIAQQIEGLTKIEIAYHVRADWRGHGLATEAAQACMALGFSHLHASQLVSMVHPANEASRMVASRIHRSHRRFMRHGANYYLFFTMASDWHVTSSTADRQPSWRV